MTDVRERFARYLPLRQKFVDDLRQFLRLVVTDIVDRLGNPMDPSVFEAFLRGVDHPAAHFGEFGSGAFGDLRKIPPN